MAPREESRDSKSEKSAYGRMAKAAASGRSKRIGVNAIVNAVGSVAYYAAVVLVTPVAIDSLGQEAWGIWQLAGAAAGLMILLNLGLNSAASYHISRSLAVGDLDVLGKSINNVRLYLNVAAGLMLLLLAVAGRPLVDSLFDEQTAEAGYEALLISVTLTAVTVPLRLFPSVLSGLQRYDLFSAFRVAAGVLLLGGAWFGLRQGMGLKGFVIVMSLAPVVPAILAWVASRMILPRECFRWRRPDVPYLFEMIRYSVSTLIYTAGLAILYQVMKFTASWNCGGPVAAGHAGLVVNVAQVVSVLFIPLTGVLHTRVSDLNGRGLGDDIPPLILRALAAMGMAAVPGLVFLGVEADSVFAVWIGSGVSAETVTQLANTLRYMLVGQGLYVVYLPCFYALLGLGEHRVFGVSMLAAGIVNAVVGFFATEMFPELPVLGLVFGLTLSVVTLAATLPATLRRFTIPVGRVVLDPVLLPLAASIPGALAVLSLPQRFDGIGDLAVSALVYGVCTLPGLVLLRRRQMREH